MNLVYIIGGLALTVIACMFSYAYGYQHGLTDGKRRNLMVNDDFEHSSDKDPTLPDGWRQ